MTRHDFDWHDENRPKMTDDRRQVTDGRWLMIDIGGQMCCFQREKKSQKKIEPPTPGCQIPLGMKAPSDYRYISLKSLRDDRQLTKESCYTGIY
jgi:hypothetical protein